MHEARRADEVVGLLKDLSTQQPARGPAAAAPSAGGDVGGEQAQPAAGNVLRDLVAQAKLSAASAARVLDAGATQLGAWASLLPDERPALLRSLRRAGLSSLCERQSLANAMGKARRDGRLDALVGACSVLSLPPPEAIEAEAVELLTGELPVDASDGGAAREQLHALADGALLERLEALGMRPLHVRLLLRERRRPVSPPSLAEVEAEAAALLRGEAEAARGDGAAEGPAREQPYPPSDALSSLPTGELLERLESLGMPPAHARVLACARGVRRGLRIGFYSNQLCERGTEVALFDYADYAERLLGAWPVVMYDGTSRHNYAPTVRKFERRFGAERVVRLCGAGEGQAAGAREIGEAIRAHRLSHVYIIKFGEAGTPPASWFAPAKTLVHAVFDARTPHGSRYARISPCVPAHASVPVVPHIVRRRDEFGPDLRHELGIPADALVFGRHGGYDVFDIPEARRAVAEVAISRPEIYFVFLNTKPIELRGPPARATGLGDDPWEWAEEEAQPQLPNLIYLPANIDDEYKSRFIRTCDAMLHARSSGETFGLAIAEFSAANRPVICSEAHTDGGMAGFHLEALKGRGIFYRDQPGLVRILTTFERASRRLKDWNAYRDYEPERVMERFRAVFLDERADGEEGLPPSLAVRGSPSYGAGHGGNWN